MNQRTQDRLARLEAATSAHVGRARAEIDEAVDEATERARIELIRIHLAGGDVAAFITTQSDHQDVLREFAAIVRHLDETI